MLPIPVSVSSLPRYYLRFMFSLRIPHLNSCWSLVASDVAAGSVLPSALSNAFISDELLEEFGASLLSCEWPQTQARVRSDTMEV